MKKIKDLFKYMDQRGIGLSCVDCKFCNKKNISEDWPTDNIWCNLHNNSLNIELIDKGEKKSYLEGEWFCKDFIDNNSALPQALKDCANIQNELEENILYEACREEHFKGMLFDDLPKS